MSQQVNAYVRTYVDASYVVTLVTTSRHWSMVIVRHYMRSLGPFQCLLQAG